MTSRNRNVDIPDNRHDSNVSYKNCVSCKKLCSNTCARCGDYYCSRKCQTEDWPDHRYVCFKMPNLIMGPALQNQNHANARIDNQHCNNGLQNGFTKKENSSTATSESQVKPIAFADAPKNNDDVILIYVKQANSYYIRTCSSSTEYENNAKDFDRHGKNGERIRDIPKRNDVILVKNRGKFVRGLVLTAESEADIEVALIDIGNKARIPLSDMRVISDDLYQRKRFNYKLTLENLGVHLEPTQWQKLLAFSKNQTVFTIKFEGDDYKSGKNFKLFEKTSGSPIEKVLLKSDEKESDVGQSAALATHKREESIELLKVNLKTDFSSKVATAPKITFKDLHFVTLPEVANLVILEDSTIFMGCASVISKENLGKLDELHARIQELASTIQEVYEPEEDEICLVFYSNEWYRARYVPPNCFLIDYGNSEIIEQKDIRKLPAELNDPCYTVFCHINGLTAEDLKKVSKHFTTLTVHSNCKVTHCNCDKGENDPNEYDVSFPIIEELLE